MTRLSKRNSLSRIVLFAVVTALLMGLCGCMEISDGRYENGTQATSHSEDVTDAPEPSVTTSESTIGTSDSDMTSMSETDEPTATSAPETEDSQMTSDMTDTDSDNDSNSDFGEGSEAPDVNDVIEPLATGGWDYSTLATELNGYGQGVRFDDYNRPKGALEFNDRYSVYNAIAIRATDESDKTIMLTFDQGYESGYTAAILDTLKEKGVKATFFVVYDYAVRNPELVQRMIDEGHTVGSHSWHHYSMPELTIEEMQEEIIYLHEYMLENFGIQMTLFRPPKGEYSELSLALTGDLGYKTVLWSFAYADWDTSNQPDPDESLAKLIERAHPGAIYLLHSVSSTNAQILGDFIDAMLAEGYEFVS